MSDQAQLPVVPNPVALLQAVVKRVTTLAAQPVSSFTAQSLPNLVADWLVPLTRDLVMLMSTQLMATLQHQGLFEQVFQQLAAQHSSEGMSPDESEAVFHLAQLWELVYADLAGRLPADDPALLLLLAGKDHFETLGTMILEELPEAAAVAPATDASTAAPAPDIASASAPAPAPAPASAPAVETVVSPESPAP